MMNRKDIVQAILNDIDQQGLIQKIKKQIETKVLFSLMFKEELLKDTSTDGLQPWNKNTMLSLATVLEFLHHRKFYYTESVFRDEIIEQLKTTKESCRQNREILVLEAMLHEDEAAIFALRRILSLSESFQNNNNNNCCLEQVIEDWLHRQESCHYNSHIRRSHSWIQ
ncbi:hypothetical protein GpartN1_g612.t1 [Galdieria partita]|uniref:LisH domain-containing protein n=1 Tax=Galdieria partita TaxID=83374 RepID=A0A9C7PS33_9RHOD|nr:hypothetical protein GpartN1_g612.t1 [Galdieria partita]